MEIIVSIVLEGGEAKGAEQKHCQRGEADDGNDDVCPVTAFGTRRIADNLRAERPRHPDRSSESICIPTLWIMMSRGVPQLKNRGRARMSQSLIYTGGS